MKLKLEEKENKKIIEAFPRSLEDVRTNIRAIKGWHANAMTVVTPSKDVKNLVSASERYIKTMEDILQFGEETLNILRNYRGEITDISAILCPIKGIMLYTNNRLNEMERIRKKITGEPFYYRSDDGQRILMKIKTKMRKDNNKIENLSYSYDPTYSLNNLRIDADKAYLHMDEATNWVVQMMKTKKADKLLGLSNDKFFNLAANTILVLDNEKKMNALSKTISDKEQYKICQSLFISFNSFLERTYTEYWALKVDNNL